MSKWRGDIEARVRGILQSMRRMGPAFVALTLLVSGVCAHEAARAKGASQGIEPGSFEDLSAQEAWFKAHEAAIRRDYSGKIVMVVRLRLYAADSWYDLVESGVTTIPGAWYIEEIPPFRSNERPLFTYERTASACRQ